MYFPPENPGFVTLVLIDEIRWFYWRTRLRPRTLKSLTKEVCRTLNHSILSLVIRIWRLYIVATWRWHPVKYTLEIYQSNRPRIAIQCFTPGGLQWICTDPLTTFSLHEEQSELALCCQLFCWWVRRGSSCCGTQQQPARLPLWLQPSASPRHYTGALRRQAVA